MTMRFDVDVLGGKIRRLDGRRLRARGVDRIGSAQRPPLRFSVGPRMARRIPFRLRRRRISGQQTALLVGVGSHFACWRGCRSGERAERAGRSTGAEGGAGEQAVDVAERLHLSFGHLPTRARQA